MSAEIIPFADQKPVEIKCSFCQRVLASRTRYLDNGIDKIICYDCILICKNKMESL